jgi:hypothetical protein
MNEDEQMKFSFPSFLNEKVHHAPLGDLSNNNNDLNTERASLAKI